jgi:lipid A disaccharide synthetase
MQSNFHVDPSKPRITIMLASRIKEVRMNLPTILEAAGQLGPEYECLLLVAPTLARSFLQEPDKSTKHYAGSRIPARLVAFAPASSPAALRQLRRHDANSLCYGPLRLVS